MSPMRGHAFVALLAVVILLSGCKEKVTDNPLAVTGRESLSDPGIMPKVIFSLPAAGSVGPYPQLFNWYDKIDRAHLVIQLNKFVNTRTITDSTIRISGPGVHVVAVPVADPYYYYYGVSGAAGKDGTAEFTDILEFSFKSTNRGRGYYNYYGQQAFEVGKTYTVTVDTTLEDINGNHLQQPYVFTFVPEPVFRVLGTYPSNGSMNALLNPTYSYGTTSISVVFNSPITSAILAKCHLTPTIEGRWALGGSYGPQDSSQVIYTIKGTQTSTPWPYGTSFNIGVDGGAQDRFGHALTTAYRSDFRTSDFVVVSVDPPDGTIATNLGGTSVRFTFSGPVDSSTVRTGVALSPSVPFSLSQWSNNEVYVNIGPLSAALVYRLTMSTAVKASNGTPLARAYSTTVVSDSFRVSYVSRSDGEFIQYLSGQNIDFTFSGPVDTASVRSGLTISPAVPYALWQSWPNGCTLSFGTLHGGTTYRITLSTTTRSTLGVSLAHSFTTTFETDSFKVVAAYPVSGATGVSRSYNPVFWTNADLKGMTTSVATAITLNPVVTGQATAAGTQGISFNLGVAMSPNTQYAATLNPGVFSWGGDTLKKPYTITFITGN